MSLDPNDPRPPYVQVAEALRASVAAGELRAGEKLPSIRELSERYGVAPMTVQHALRILREGGLIVSWQGRGSYVRDQADAETAPREAADASYDELIGHLTEIQEQLRRLDERVTRIEEGTRTKSR